MNQKPDQDLPDFENPGHARLRAFFDGRKVEGHALGAVDEKPRNRPAHTRPTGRRPMQRLVKALKIGAMVIGTTIGAFLLDPTGHLQEAGNRIGAGFENLLHGALHGDPGIAVLPPLQAIAGAPAKAVPVQAVIPGMAAQGDMQFTEAAPDGAVYATYPIPAIGSQPFQPRPADSATWRVEGEPKPLIGAMAGDYGAVIRYAVWQADAQALQPGQQPNTMVLAMGRTEPMERYQHEAAYWAAKGYNVFAMDWQGQGLSSLFHPDIERAFVPDYDVHLRDFNRFMATVVEPHATGQLLIKGHSMGGFITTKYLADYDQSSRAKPVDAAIMTAPMYRIDYPPHLPEWLSEEVAEYEVRSGHGAEYATGQSRWQYWQPEPDDPRYGSPRHEAHQRMMQANPDMRIGGASFRWIQESIRAQDAFFAKGALERITTPLLIFKAGEDDTVENSAIDSASARIKGARTYQMGPDTRHGLPHGSDANLAIMRQQIESFLRDKLAAKPAHKPGL